MRYMNFRGTQVNLDQWQREVGLPQLEETCLVQTPKHSSESLIHSQGIFSLLQTVSSPMLRLHQEPKQVFFSPSVRVLCQSGGTHLSTSIH